MKRQWKLFFPVMLALTLTEPQPAIAGLIVDVDGSVAIRRSGSSEYAPTGVGAQIFPGDEVKAERGTVTILASDLTRLIVSDSDQSFLLSPFEGKQPIDDKCPDPAGGIICPRGPIDLEIPYIISPRSTKILKPTFTLSWNAVPYSSFYDVTIRNDGDILWQRDTTDTTMVYENEWALQPNTSYLLIVEASNGRSSYEEIENGAVNLGFELLDEPKIEEIQQAIAKLTDLGLPPEAETLALAHLYIGAELRLEAIEQLKSLIDQGNRNPAIHRTLGDVYAAIGLNALAEKAYLEAFQLANSTEDIEEQAAAATGLAETYEILANYREAHSWVIEGLQRYQQLDDSDQVYELVLMLERLSELV
jgi:hypothetical protein